ncbi:MAG: hypothetical protein QW228_04495 [Candidatus Aenigmatarchaeota archaeon]
MEVSLKFSLKNTVILVLIVSLVLALIISTQLKLPVYSVNYKGKKMNFRTNLRDAEKVVVIPNEKNLREKIFNNLVDNITIVFKPGDELVNAHYAAEVFEITYKLTLAYKLNFAYIPRFNVVNVTSYEGLKGSEENPVVALIHPIYSNETSVRVDDSVVYIQGKNSEKLEEQLRNFDLAVAKFLMVALDIKLT